MVFHPSIFSWKTSFHGSKFILKFILKFFYSFIFANFYFTILQTTAIYITHINYSVSETDGLELFLQMKFIVVYKEKGRRQFLRSFYMRKTTIILVCEQRVMRTNLTRIIRLFDKVLEYLTKIFLACKACYIVDAFRSVEH